MKSRIAPFILALVALAWGVPAIAAGTEPAIDLKRPIRSEGKAVSLEVADMDATKAVSALSNAIGEPVVLLTPPGDRKVTLKFTDLPVSKALDRIAAELGCKWQRRYTISRKQPNTPVLERRPSGKLVTIELSDQKLQTVAKILARAAGAIVNVERGLEGNVSLKAVDMPIEQALNTICEPIKADWKVEYILAQTTDVKPVEEAKAKPKTEEPITRIENKANYTQDKTAKTAQPADDDSLDKVPNMQGPRAFPNTQPIWELFGGGTSPDQLNTRITQNINNLFNLPADERAKRIQSLSEGLYSVAHHFDDADPESLKGFYQRMGPGFRAGQDVINNLPADRRSQMKPIQDAIERILKNQPK